MPQSLLLHPPLWIWACIHRCLAFLKPPGQGFKQHSWPCRTQCLKLTLSADPKKICFLSLNCILQGTIYVSRARAQCNSCRCQSNYCIHHPAKLRLVLSCFGAMSTHTLLPANFQHRVGEVGGRAGGVRAAWIHPQKGVRGSLSHALCT